MEKLTEPSFKPSFAFRVKEAIAILGIVSLLLVPISFVFVSIETAIAQDIPPFPVSGAPPSEAGSWAPYIGWGITVLIALAGGAWSMFRELSTKKIDLQREQESQKLSLELENLKLDFENRKNYTDRMEANRDRLEKEIERKDAELWKAFGIIQERDKTIREQHDMIFELKSKVSKLELDVAHMKKSVNELQK